MVIIQLTLTRSVIRIGIPIATATTDTHTRTLTRISDTGADMGAAGAATGMDTVGTHIAGTAIGAAMYIEAAIAGA
jgi:hypothetical protein